MALSADQVFLLNTLTYMSKDGVYSATSGDQVGDFVQTLINSPSLRDSLADPFMTSDQILAACQQIAGDPTLSSMTIAHASRTDGGADRLVFVAPEGSTDSQAVIALEGTTGANEWRDDAYGAANTDCADHVSTAHQEADLKWFQSDDVQGILDSCDTVTVSGHSKGGNKAKYITVMDDRVDECISFDGQGFSDEFMNEYAPDISKNQHKIQNYNNADDYVSILLNDIGDTHYIEGTPVDNPMENHSLFTLTNSIPMSEHTTEQNQLLNELDQCLNGFLRTLNPEDTLLFAELIGEILALTLGGDGSISTVLEVLSLTRELGFDKLGDLLRYIFTYAGYELAEALLHLLKEHCPWLADWLDDLIKHVQRKGSLPDGNDLTVSADRIKMDTMNLTSVAIQLSRIYTALSDCIGSVNRCATLCDDFNISVNLSFTISMVLAHGISGILSGTPAHVLKGLSRDLRELAKEVEKLSGSVKKAATSFEENEERIVSFLPDFVGAPGSW